ncbi:DUF4390 domain-containing protein [Basilea psittacipulmonis]|nr:DUF4390 domain-containing protein [Basilea psittacipulmonis]
MPNSKKELKHFPFKRYVFLLCSIVLMAVVLAWPSGESNEKIYSMIDIKHVTVNQDHRNFYLSVEADLSLQKELLIAVQRGVPLSFTYELEIYRKEAGLSQLYRTQKKVWTIYHHVLLKQWSIQTDRVVDIELSLEDCLKHLTSLRRWAIGTLDALPDGQTYEAKIRLYLDPTLLPRAFEFDVLSNPNLSLKTTWKTFEIKSPQD